MNQKDRKPVYKRAVGLSISVPGIMVDDVNARMQHLGYTQRSHYVQFLIRNDIAQSKNEIQQPIIG